MDELERRLRGEQDALRDATPRSGPSVYGSVRAGVRRRRAVRATLTSAAAVVVAGVVGVGAWGLVSADRGQAPAMPDSSPSPSATPTAAASPQPSSPSEPAGDPRFDDSLDGIAEDALPALAADRGDLVPGDEYTDSVPYPEAHVMEDWVWDAVGAGWTLDVASVQFDIGYMEGEGRELPVAVLYLVSPEDVRFELFELPERTWASTRVTSWREDQGVATLWWSTPFEDERDGQGAQVDLRSGAVDDLVMAVYGETATDYRFIMANAQGDELWRAESSAGVKYYRWSEGADEDGWIATALVEQEPDADELATDIGSTGPTAATDGDTVLLRPVEEASGTGTRVTVIAYTLSTDSIETFVFDGVPPGSDLMHAVLVDEQSLIATLDYPDDVSVQDSPHSSDTTLFRLDGSGRMEPAQDDASFWDGNEPPAQPVGYAEATPRSAAVELCGC